MRITDRILMFFDRLRKARWLTCDRLERFWYRLRYGVRV